MINMQEITADTINNMPSKDFLVLLKFCHNRKMRTYYRRNPEKVKINNYKMKLRKEALKLKTTLAE
jgi:hypothetical protein